jgi:hypothetical protein
MPNSPAVDTSTDTNHVRRVKYSSLMERTRRLTLIAAEQGNGISHEIASILTAVRFGFKGAKELKNTTPEFRYEFRQTEISVRHLISTLPELPPFPSPLNPSFEAQFADLALVHTLAWGTLIRLHAIFPLEGSESREKVVKAAKMITGIAEILEGIHEIWWQIPINVSTISNHPLYCLLSQRELFSMSDRWHGATLARSSNRKSVVFFEVLPLWIKSDWIKNIKYWN